MKRGHWTGLAFVVIISVVAEMLTPHETEHATHWWSGVPAFSALFGLLGCIVIILFANVIGQHFLLKRADYYAAV